MASGENFEFFKWLAELLGPGGFVAALAAGAEGWFIFKLYGWHHKERVAWQLKCAEERKEVADQCATERETWHEMIQAMTKEKRERFSQMRRDGKEQWNIVNTLKPLVEQLLKKGMVDRRGKRGQ